MKARIRTATLTALVILLLPQVSLADRLRDAVENLTRTTYGRDLDRLDDDEMEDVAENVVYVAEEIRDGESAARRHIIDEHGDGRSSRSHVSKCPYCLGAAEEVAAGTPLEDALPPDRTPNCFLINRVYYRASDWGTLHRVGPYGLGPAEGIIWFYSGQYIGIGYNGVRLRAEPARC